MYCATGEPLQPSIRAPHRSVGLAASSVWCSRPETKLCCVRNRAATQNQNSQYEVTDFLIHDTRHSVRLEERTRFGPRLLLLPWWFLYRMATTHVACHGCPPMALRLTRTSSSWHLVFPRVSARARCLRCCCKRLRGVAGALRCLRAYAPPTTPHDVNNSAAHACCLEKTMKRSHRSLL
jgi:hypothetical protein